MFARPTACRIKFVCSFARTFGAASSSVSQSVIIPNEKLHDDVPHPLYTLAGWEPFGAVHT